MKKILLLAGDAAALYASLFLTLLIRYGGGFYGEFVDAHAAPFSVIFAIWLLVFYVAGLYDLHRLRDNIDFARTLALSTVAGAAIAVGFFYLVPAVGISPKTNLFLFVAIFGVIEWFWRKWFNRAISSGAAPTQIAAVGKSRALRQAMEFVSANPQLGYGVRIEVPEPTGRGLDERIRRSGSNFAVVDHRLAGERGLGNELYRLMMSGVEVADSVSFYEETLRRTPLDEIEKTWFLDHPLDQRKFYDDLKRGAEVAAAAVLIAVLLPLEALIALLVKATSAGPVFIRQTRLGKRGRPFTLYKFRSMKALAEDGSAETAGAVWAAQNDSRATAIGKIIRRTHLDELPQLWNILKGDLSFVGPRPERPEIAGELAKKVGYYDLRLLVPPGVTGWAQINHGKDETLADVATKLSYDVYYIRHRSLVLDAAIVIKTLKAFFVTPPASKS